MADIRLSDIRLRARICAARIALHAAEVSGCWQAIEAAHGRLLRLEIEQWIRERAKA